MRVDTHRRYRSRARSKARRARGFQLQPRHQLACSDAPPHAGADSPSHSSSDIPLRPETSTSVAAHGSFAGAENGEMDSRKAHMKASRRSQMGATRIWSCALRRNRHVAQRRISSGAMAALLATCGASGLDLDRVESAFLIWFKLRPPQARHPAREPPDTEGLSRTRSRLPASSRR